MNLHILEKAVMITIIAGCVLIAAASGRAQTHNVQGLLYYSNGDVPNDGEITFQAHVTARPSEILTGSDTGCGYGRFDTEGWWWVNVGNFPSDWSAGEILRVEFESTRRETGSLEYTLTNGTDITPDLYLAVSSTPTPTSTPADTPTSTPTSDPTSTPTSTPAPPTNTPAPPTATPAPTMSPTSTPSGTPESTATPTPIPVADFGNVVINEIAWAGTRASESDEWIELCNNTGRAIDLTGWTLRIDDGNQTPSDVALAGTIEPYGYFLIESIDDYGVSDIAGDMVLGMDFEIDDAGALLELRSASGRLVDVANRLGPWFAGTHEHTMERVDPAGPGTDEENWLDNDPSIARNGLDAHGDPINGTPRRLNSASIAPEPSATPGPLTPTPIPDLSNYINLEVSPSTVNGGDAITLSWRCDFSRWNYEGVPVNVYLAAVKDPACVDEPCGVDNTLAGGIVHLFGPGMESVYTGAVRGPAFRNVAFPPAPTSGSLTITAPAAGFAGNYVFATAFISAGGFVRTDLPVEISNPVTIR